LELFGNSFEDVVVDVPGSGDVSLIVGALKLPAVRPGLVEFALVGLDEGELTVREAVRRALLWRRRYRYCC